MQLLEAQPAERTGDKRRHRQQGERRQDATDQGEEQAHRQAPGGGLGALTRRDPNVDVEPVEGGAEGGAVAIS